jgi:hypothetical protein
MAPVRGGFTAALSSWLSIKAGGNHDEDHETHTPLTKDSKMKTYTVLFAEDVPHYGTVEIEAEDDNAALEVAKAYNLSEVTTDPEWESGVCARIVYIEDQSGKTIHYDVPLDDYILLRRGKEEPRFCDAAQELSEALIRIDEHPKEFGDIEDAETMLCRIQEIARAAIVKAKEYGLAMGYDIPGQR